VRERERQSERESVGECDLVNDRATETRCTSKDRHNMTMIYMFFTVYLDLNVLDAVIVAGTITFLVVIYSNGHQRSFV
jgi:hypothetical protein